MAIVMVVDDSETLRLQVKDVIESKGHSVVEASNGIEGLETLKSNPNVRLIFCDVNMPLMDGLTMCRTIQETPELPKPPIVILSPEYNADVRKQAKEWGVIAWITKPATPEKIMIVIEKILDPGNPA